MDRVVYAYLWPRAVLKTTSFKWPEANLSHPIRFAGSASEPRRRKRNPKRRERGLCRRLPRCAIAVTGDVPLTGASAAVLPEDELVGRARGDRTVGRIVATIICNDFRFEELGD